MSKGSNTTTTSQTPTALPAYQGAIGQLQNVAATPYTPYGGQLVSPVNEQQQTGIGNINQYAQAGVPYLQQAAGLQEGAANPLTAGQIQQYYSPYQQDVVGATEAQFNNQNAMQQQQVLGNAAAQGALGGDRTAVAQSVLAGQQQAQEAPVIAGLENQGYAQALQTAGQQFQQNPEQAAYGIASTGQGLENAALTGANAQVGAGTLEQQTQQAQDTAAYQQFMQSQFMPESMLSWELPLLTGVGSQEGGTSQTTAPAPNQTAQYAGLGLAALGMFANRGGRVQGLQGGGVAGLGGFTPGALPGNPWLAAPNMPRGPGAPMPPKGPGQVVQTPQQMADQATKLAKGIGGAGPGLNNLFGQSATYGGGDILSGDVSGGSASSPLQGLDASDYGGGAGSFVSDGLGLFSNRGGRIELRRGGVPVRAGLGMASFMPRRGFADGGSPDDDAVTIANDDSGLGGKSDVLPQSGIGTASPSSTQRMIVDAARTHGVDPNWALAVARQESGAQQYDAKGNPKVSSAGAIGTMQLMPATAKGLGVDPYDSQQNIDGGVRYLKQMYDRYGGDQHLASAAYNAGPGRVDDFINKGTPLPSETQNYVPNVMAFAEENPNTSTGTYPGLFSGLTGSRGAAPSTAPDSVNAAPAQTQGLAQSRADSQPSGIHFGFGLMSPDAKSALMAAGLGMMASRSPFLGTAIGEGGLAGLSAYGGLKKQEQDVDLKVRQLDQAAKAEQDRIAQETKKINLAEQAQTFGQTGISATEQAKLAQTQQQYERQLNAPRVMTPGQELVNPVTGKTIATNESGLMTDAAVNLAVDRIHAGDQSALQNLGRGAQTGQNLTRIQNRLAERAANEGWSGADLAAAKANFTSQSAAASMAAKRESTVQSAVEEAKNTFPLAEQASAALPRSSFVPWNKAVQMVQAGTSSPELARYVTSLRGAITAYSQAMSRTGTNSVYAQGAAEHLLEQASGPEAIKATLDQMRKEMDAAVIAPETVRQAIMARIAGRPAPPPVQMPGAIAPQSAKPPAMQSNGWIYKLQPDGSYNDPSPQKGG